MHRFLNRSELRNRILVNSILILLFSFVLLGILINIFFSNVLDMNAKDKTLQAIAQANLSMDNYLNEAQRFAGLIARDNDVQEFFAWSAMSNNPDELQIKSNVRNLLTDMVQIFPHMRGIALINESGLVLSNEMYRQSSASFQDERWYQECITNPDRAYIIKKQENRILSYYESVSTDDVVSIVTAVNAGTKAYSAGIIIIDVDMGFIEDIISATETGSGGFIYIVDEDGQIVHSPVNKIIPRIKSKWFTEEEGVFNKRLLNQDFQFVSFSSGNTGWRTVGIFSLSEARASISQFQVYLIAILALCIVVASLLTAIVAFSISQPALKLNALMQSVQNGNLQVRYDGEEKDEIGRLGGVFNNMLEKISELLGLVKKEQQLKRQAELLVLREQIKPHFLYNTFDSIQWLAYRRGASEIVELVTALSSLFRIGLSGGKEVIALKDELSHALNYLTIQKIRYQEKIEYFVSCDCNAQELYVQKLILQPLIENAIYHGVKAKDGSGTICVNAYQEGGTLILEVCDDGVGIEPDKLEALNGALVSKTSQSIGYGLFNINERIRLSYGQEYGVKLLSKPGHTFAIITHPVITDYNGAIEEV